MTQPLSTGWIEKLLADATPGGWTAFHPELIFMANGISADTAEGPAVLAQMNWHIPNWKENAALIAAAPSALRFLLDELKTARNLIKEICAEWNEDCEVSCDKWGHDGECKSVSIAAAKRALQSKLAQSEADYRAYKVHYDKIFESSVVIPSEEYTAQVVERERLVDTLIRIADPEPSSGRPAFSIEDLRDIARQALAKLRGERD